MKNFERIPMIPRKSSLQVRSFFVTCFILTLLATFPDSLYAEPEWPKRPYSYHPDLKPATPDLDETPWDDSIHNKKIAGGLSFPVDDGRGYPTPYGYFLWDKRAWPSLSTDFRLFFAAIQADAELVIRESLGETRDLVLGFGYELDQRYEEYSRGQVDLGSRMQSEWVAGRIGIQQHIQWNYVEIGKALFFYELGDHGFRGEEQTASNFVLPNDGLFQSLVLHLGFGKIKDSQYAPAGWELRLRGEAAFRDDWTAWGYNGSYLTSSTYQKLMLQTGYVFSSIQNQKMLVHFRGGMGNDLDRLSVWKIGSSLTGKPGTLPLHGFYFREIFAKDFAMLNTDYVIPLIRESQLALHLYGDAAVTQREDVPNASSHVWAGVGSAASFTGFFQTEWLIGYAHGVNAPRGEDHGGHELFMQVNKTF
jgi:hypothetical protein